MFQWCNDSRHWQCNSRGIISEVRQRLNNACIFHLLSLIGLSKERPILGHHANAHIFEIRRISCEIHPKPYKIRCLNKNSSVWGVQGGGYDPGFHEIRGHSPSPAFIKLNSFGWNICFYKVLGGFHADFMKSARFHVKSKDHLQGIVTLFTVFFLEHFVTYNKLIKVEREK